MDKYSGRFSNLMKESDNSAVRLLDLVLENFKCFRDWVEFKGREVSFNKRAQILVADIWCLYEGISETFF